MQDQSIDRRRGGSKGEIAGQGLADVVRGAEHVGEGREISGQLEVTEADARDVGDQGVAHVIFRDGAADVGDVVRDHPRHDALVKGDRVDRQAGGAGRGRSAEDEGGRVGDADDVGAGGDAGAGHAHVGHQAGGGGHRDVGASGRRGAGRQGDIGPAAADHGVDEVRLLARVTDEPIDGVYAVVGGRRTKRTAADEGGGLIGTKDARGTESDAAVTGSNARKVARSGVEVDVIDVLSVVAAGVPHGEAEGDRVGVVGTGDEVAAGTGGGIQVDIDGVADRTGAVGDVTDHVKGTVSIDRDFREVTGDQGIIDSTAATVGGADQDVARVDDQAAVVAADVAERERPVADHPQGAETHQLAREVGILGLVDGERGAESQVDERILGIGLAVAAGDRADGLAIGRSSLDDGRTGGGQEGGGRHHEATAGVDHEGLRGARSDVRGAGEHETVDRDRVDDGVEGAIEAGCCSGDGKALAGGDAVTARGGHLGDGGDIERDGRSRGRGGRAERDAGAWSDRGDVGPGRDARTSDRLANHESRGAGDGDGGAGVGGRGAREDRGGNGDVAGGEIEARDARTGVDAVARKNLADAQTQGAVDLDHGGTDRRGAGDAGKADAIHHHAEIGSITVREDDRRGVAHGEGTAAGTGELKHAALQLDEAAEIVGESAGAEHERAVTCLGKALLTFDRGGDQQPLGRVQRIRVAEDVGGPTLRVVPDDELAGRRAQGAALQHGHGARRIGDAGLGGDGRTIDEESGRIDDLGDARARRQAGAADGHAGDQAGGAGDADREGAHGGGARSEGQVGRTGAEGLQDAAGDDLEDAAVRDGKDGRSGRVEADADRRDDVLQRAGVAGDVGDVLTVGDAGEGVAGGHRDGHDVRADAGGEAGGTAAVRDGGGGAEGAEKTGEQVVRSRRRDAVRGALRTGGQHEPDGAGDALGDRSEVEDEVTTGSAEEFDRRVATGRIGGDLRQGEAGDRLADVEIRVAEQADAAAAKVDATGGVETVGDEGAGRGGIIKEREAGVETGRQRAVEQALPLDAEGTAALLDPGAGGAAAIDRGVDDEVGLVRGQAQALTNIENTRRVAQREGRAGAADDARGLRVAVEGIDVDVTAERQRATVAEQDEALGGDGRVAVVEVERTDALRAAVEVEDRRLGGVVDRVGGGGVELLTRAGGHA